MKHRRVAIAYILVLLTGCAGLIGVPDIAFDEKAEQGKGGSATGSVGDGGSSSGTTSSSSGSSGTTSSSGSSGEAGPTCDATKVQSDPANCGRCGHDCLGGDCVSGECKAVQIGAISNAPLRRILEHGSSIYVSTMTTLTTQEGGIWKAPKTSGNAVKYVDYGNAEDMVIVGDTLYFVVREAPFNDGGDLGGLWSCDLNGPTPCVPTLVAAADSPIAISTADGKVYYNDGKADAIMQYAPGGAPTVYRPGFGFTYTIWAQGESAFYAHTIFNNPQRGVLFSIYPDAGDVAELSRYEKPNVANSGELLGTVNALYFTAYDYQATTGGIVRRVSRPGTAGVAPCDFGGNTNKRPYGMYVDATRIYWTNQGDFASPYANGSVNYCDVDGCCTTPKTPWTGDGEPDSITGDATALYWTTYRTGKIWKMAKP